MEGGEGILFTEFILTPLEKALLSEGLECCSLFIRGFLAFHKGTMPFDLTLTADPLTSTSLRSLSAHRQATWSSTFCGNILPILILNATALNVFELRARLNIPSVGEVISLSLSWPLPLFVCYIYIYIFNHSLSLRGSLIADYPSLRPLFDQTIYSPTMYFLCYMHALSLLNRSA